MLYADKEEHIFAIISAVSDLQSSHYPRRAALISAGDHITEIGAAHGKDVVGLFRE